MGASAESSQDERSSPPKADARKPIWGQSPRQRRGESYSLSWWELRLRARRLSASGLVLIHPTHSQHDPDLGIQTAVSRTDLPPGLRELLV